MTMKPYSIEFDLPRSTRAGRVSTLFERIDLGVLDKGPPCYPVEKSSGRAPATGVHPAVIKVALSAVIWFLAVAWLDFSGGPEIDPSLAVATGLFVMFLTLLLVTASTAVNGQRWQRLPARRTVS